MYNKYYNLSWFLKIRKLVQERHFEYAIYEYQKYLERYPEDFCCHAYYADCLLRCNKIDEAKMVLDDIIIYSSIPLASKQDLILSRIKLLCCQNKYQECYELFLENINIFEEREISHTELLIFLKKQLNLLCNVDYSGYNYKTDQIIDYSEERALECIRKFRFVPISENSCVFNENFLLEDTYYKLRSILPNESKICDSFIENTYIFKYDNCGKVGNKNADYIEVITLQGSNDIIMIYPYENKKRIPCLDLTPIKEDLSKVKRISQIDKFNQRYNK